MANRFRYTGEEFDPNLGFTFLRARWMDNSSGRFLGVDPYAGDPMSPASLHRYMYANNSPISFSDPSGNITLMEVGQAMMISSSIASMGLFSFGVVSSFYTPPIKWKGLIGILNVSINSDYFNHTLGGGNILEFSNFGPGISVFGIYVESFKNSIKKSAGFFAGIAFGYSFGVSLYGYSGSIGQFDMETPGVLGHSPYILSGPYTSGGISIGVGIGGAASMFQMGFGTGYLQHGLIAALDGNASFISGISIPLLVGTNLEGVKSAFGK